MTSKSGMGFCVFDSRHTKIWQLADFVALSWDCIFEKADLCVPFPGRIPTCWKHHTLLCSKFWSRGGSQIRIKFGTFPADQTVEKAAIAHLTPP
jgi:hypothetical protein